MPCVFPVVKVTTAAICGSDCHMYEGRTAAEAGIIFGHENSERVRAADVRGSLYLPSSIVGIVDEVGPGVTLYKKG